MTDWRSWPVGCVAIIEPRFVSPGELDRILDDFREAIDHHRQVTTRVALTGWRFSDHAPIYKALEGKTWIEGLIERNNDEA